MRVFLYRFVFVLCFVLFIGLIVVSFIPSLAHIQWLQCTLVILFGLGGSVPKIFLSAKATDVQDKRTAKYRIFMSLNIIATLLIAAMIVSVLAFDAYIPWPFIALLFLGSFLIPMSVKRKSVDEPGIWSGKTG